MKTVKTQTLLVTFKLVFPQGEERLNFTEALTTKQIQVQTLIRVNLRAQVSVRVREMVRAKTL